MDFFGGVRPSPGAFRRRFNPSVMMMVMMLALMPLLVDFFPVAMGVNHRQDKENKPAHQQHNDDWLIPPEVADKL